MTTAPDGIAARLGLSEDPWTGWAQVPRTSWHNPAKEPPRPEDDTAVQTYLAHRITGCGGLALIAEVEG